MQTSPTTQLHANMVAFSKQKGQPSDPQGMYKEIKKAIEKKDRNRSRPEYVALENYVESLTSKGNATLIISYQLIFLGVLTTQPFYGIDFESLLTVAGGTSNSSTWPCEVGMIYGHCVILVHYFQLMAMILNNIIRNIRIYFRKRRNETLPSFH
jgi:hypothetical protein